MKVCPVCEMEEEDNALSCSMCGSDFEPSVKEAPQIEDETKESDDVSSDIEAMNLEDLSTKEKDSEDIKELSEEEKLLEETLNATETTSTGERTNNVLSKFLDNIPQLGKFLQILAKRLDRIFLSKGEINYIAPLTIVVLSILLLSGVIGLAVSTVPTTSQESLDGYMPSDPYNKPTPDGNSTLIGRGTSDPFSGEPFNCEIWIARYIDFVKSTIKASIFYSRTEMKVVK